MQSLTSSSHASYHNVYFCHDQNGVRSTWSQKCLVWLSRLACVYLTWLCEYGKQIDFKEKSHTVTSIFILAWKFNLNDGRGKSKLHTHTHYQFFWGCYISPPDVLYLTNFCNCHTMSEGSTPPWATAARLKAPRLCPGHGLIVSNIMIYPTVITTVPTLKDHTRWRPEFNGDSTVKPRIDRVTYGDLRWSTVMVIVLSGVVCHIQAGSTSVIIWIVMWGFYQHHHRIWILADSDAV